MSLPVANKAGDYLVMRSCSCRILSIKLCPLLQRPISPHQSENYSYKQLHRRWRHFESFTRWPLGDEAGFISAQAGRGPPYRASFQAPRCQGAVRSHYSLIIGGVDRHEEV